MAPTREEVMNATRSLLSIALAGLALFPVEVSGATDVPSSANAAAAASARERCSPPAGGVMRKGKCGCPKSLHNYGGVCFAGGSGTGGRHTVHSRDRVYGERAG